MNNRYHIEFGACDLCDGQGEVATHEDIGLTLCGGCIAPVVTSPRPPNPLPGYMEAWLRLMRLQDLIP
jgi:hypothetical protein